MEKSLFISKQRKDANREKVNLYTKKLSSSAPNHRKKALFRLLQLDVSFLQNFSIRSGFFHLTEQNIFLTAPEQMRTLQKYLKKLKKDLQFKKGEYSHFFEFDEIGMIKPGIKTLLTSTWEKIKETGNFKKLPDPRTHIFWRKIKFLEEDLSDSVEEIGETKPKQDNPKNFFPRSKKRKNCLMKRTFRIRSQSRKNRVIISQDSFSKNNDNYASPSFQREEKFFKKSSKELKKMLNLLNQRTNGKISPDDSPMFYTPKYRSKPLISRNNPRKFSGASKFSINRKKNKETKEIESIGKFESAVRIVKKRRQEDDNCKRGWSLKIRKRKYETKQRMSFF